MRSGEAFRTFKEEGEGGGTAWHPLTELWLTTKKKKTNGWTWIWWNEEHTERLKGSRNGEVWIKLFKGDGNRKMNKPESGQRCVKYGDFKKTDWEWTIEKERLHGCRESFLIIFLPFYWDKREMGDGRTNRPTESETNGLTYPLAELWKQLKMCKR